MNNKKSLLQDSLQELENIKNESLELAKEQLINESADLLEKKSAELFEKLIAGEDIEEGEKEESIEEESFPVNEILEKLKNISEGESDEEEMSSDEEESDEEEVPSDDEDSNDEEEMDLDSLRKAAEEHGFKLVQADSDEEDMESDEEEMDSDEEEDIEFGDEESDDEEFSDVDVDDKVLAEPSDDEEESQKINENFKRNNTKMRNTKKQVLRDLRDVSFNKLVEAYYNMDEEDSFVVKEDEYMDEESYDEGYGMEDDEMPDYSNIGQLEEYVMDEDMYDEGYDMDDDLPSSPTGGEYGGEYGDLGEEEVMYEIDMPEGNYGMESMSDEGFEMSDEDINEMLSEMDVEETMHDVEKVSGMDKMQPRKGKSVSELEEMFQEMSMEELEEMNQMLQEEGDGDVESYQDGQGGAAIGKGGVRFKTSPKEDYMNEQDLTEAEIEEMLASMKEEEDIEEGMSLRRSQANKHQAPSPRNREERIRPLAEEDDEDVESLKEQLKKLKQENKSLNEGFVNKVKSLENKVYDVTISALKAGFVNKFLLEHPLRENEKLEIIHRFSNAQTKEQIKETYVSLTNEFAKKQIVKDGSMLNESVQNKVSKIHRTDNVVVTEKNLINENDETNRFKQLLNYNFGKRK